MSHRSQTAKIHPLAVAMVRAGVRPRVKRRQPQLPGQSAAAFDPRAGQRGVIIPFPVPPPAKPARAAADSAPADTPLIALSPYRHAPAAAAALLAGFALVALVMRLAALAS